MNLSTQLNQIRASILHKRGIQVITPSDCKAISIEIQTNFKKNVSETTIKRFFGFASVSYNFSRYTLMALSEYASSFTEEGDRTAAEDASWARVRERAARVVNMALKAMQYRSGIPITQTIGRSFAARDLLDFYEREERLMCFIANSGLGKTTLLSHLVTDCFLADDAPYANSVIVFVRTLDLFKPNGSLLTVEDYIKRVLGIPTQMHLISYLDKQCQLQGGKFFLIFDNFTELVSERKIKDEFFGQILDFLQTIKQTSVVKVIMSMRPTGWTRFYTRMEHLDLKDDWFRGHQYSEETGSNVPLLSELEVNRIAMKSGLNLTSCSNPMLMEQLKFPIHLQFYLQFNKEDYLEEYPADLIYYELIYRFIREKIYQSNYYTEKLMLLKQFVSLTAFGHLPHFVLKADLTAGLSVFKNAYAEMISDGILIEKIKHRDGVVHEYVGFLNHVVYEYFLFIGLCAELKTDPNELQGRINALYSDSPVKFALYQWVAWQGQKLQRPFKR
jgi:hypothetical protein